MSGNDAAVDARLAAGLSACRSNGILRGMAEIVLLVVVAALPLLIGAACSYLRRPWWWGALVAVALFLLAAIVPEPEAGEPRVAAGDIGFLVVVGLLVSGLVWAGWAAHRRLARRRRGGAGVAP